MRTLRALSFVLAFAAATALVFGTVGFSAVYADRGVSTNVVEDDQAFLALEIDDPVQVSGDEEAVLFTVTNQFGEEVTELDVTVTDSGEFDDVLVDHRVNLGVGEKSAVNVSVSNDEPYSAEIEVTIHADTDSSNAEITRSIVIGFADETSEDDSDGTTEEDTDGTTEEDTDGTTEEDTDGTTEEDSDEPTESDADGTDD